MTQKELINKLHERAMEVTFVKKNGEKRRMICTLMPHVTGLHAKEGDYKPRKPGLITVFDIEKDDWRCFYFDKVIDVKPFDAYNGEFNES